MEDKFQMWGKWFWIGIAMGFFNGFAGVVYGIALLTEKDHHKEGAVIIIWSVFISFAEYFFVKAMINAGYYPKLTVDLNSLKTFQQSVKLLPK